MALGVLDPYEVQTRQRALELVLDGMRSGTLPPAKESEILQTAARFAGFMLGSGPGQEQPAPAAPASSYPDI